ncbi:MAG: hypothetical protein EBZ48_05600, partial [Proteobacteria bacterium]|nr:hypothetical protein [Pseudomonadota bacterium]
SIGGLRNLSLDGRNLYAATPFNALRLETNQIRANILGSEHPVDFWIGYSDFPGLYFNNDFFKELIFHAILSEAERPLYFNPFYEYLHSVTGQPSSVEYPLDRILNATLAELDSFAGYADRRTKVAQLQGWGSDYLLSCAIANGGWRICRFTAPNSISPATIGQNGTVLTVQSDAIQLLFPRGVAVTTRLSQHGVWIKQPPGAPLYTFIRRAA